MNTTENPKLNKHYQNNTHINSMLSENYFISQNMTR